MAEQPTLIEQYKRPLATWERLVIVAGAVSAVAVLVIRLVTGA